LTICWEYKEIQGSSEFANQIGRDAGKEGIPISEFWEKIAEAGFTPEFSIDRKKLVISAHLRRVGDRYFNKGFVMAPPSKSAKRRKTADTVVKPAAVHTPNPLVLALNNGEVTITSEHIEARFRKVRQVTIEFE
jgi:hypothetical protein